MVDIPFHWVDVFADKPFKGSPAAVCIIEDELSDDTYLNIAAEINLRETAYTMKINEGEYKLRWFTPIREVPFCGHATIATAYTLVHEYHETTPITFQSQIGKLEATVNDNRVTLSFPRGETEKTVNEALLKKLGITDYIEMRKITRPRLAYMVEVEDAEDAKMLEPDMVGVQELLRELDAYFVAVTAKGFELFDYVYRVFNQMDEDHGCVTANVLLGPYWSRKLGKCELLVHQPTYRETKMRIEVLDDRMKVSGSVTQLIKGTLTT